MTELEEKQSTRSEGQESPALGQEEKPGEGRTDGADSWEGYSLSTLAAFFEHC